MSIHSPAVIICMFRAHVAIIAAALLLSSAPVAAQPVDASLLAIQYFDVVLGEMDLEVAAAIVAPDALIHTPEGEFQGSEGAGQFASTLRTSFSNVTFVTQEPLIADDLVIVRWTMTGTHSGDYQGLASACGGMTVDGASGGQAGIAPQCVGVTVDGIAILRIDGARIVEQWIEYDRLSLVNQIETFGQQPAPDVSAPTCGPDCLKPHGNR